MWFNVVMLAHQPEVQIYPLNIPLLKEEEQKLADHLISPTNESKKFVQSVLEKVFEEGNRRGRPYGNLFCSVSAGDVVLLGNERWICGIKGWTKITNHEMHAYCKLARRDRQFSHLIEAE